jgi:hypothetical protein
MSTNNVTLPIAVGTRDRCKNYEGRCVKGLADGQPTDEHCFVCPLYDGPARGLGDQVHNVAQVTGVKWIADKISQATRRPCGCEERRKRLNELKPREH